MTHWFKNKLCWIFHFDDKRNTREQFSSDFHLSALLPNWRKANAFTTTILNIYISKFNQKENKKITQVTKQKYFPILFFSHSILASFLNLFCSTNFYFEKISKNKSEANFRRWHSNIYVRIFIILYYYCILEYKYKMFMGIFFSLFFRIWFSFWFCMQSETSALSHMWMMWNINERTRNIHSMQCRW